MYIETHRKVTGRSTDYQPQKEENFGKLVVGGMIGRKGHFSHPKWWIISVEELCIFVCSIVWPGSLFVIGK